MATRQRWEKRSLGTALKTYLQSAGWNVAYSEGYISDESITPPQIAVTFPPSRKKELQIGRIPGKDSLFKRIVQIDAYMEDEIRAEAITDDIMDFLDLTPVEIKDHTATFLGTLICQDTDSIFAETLPPLSMSPKIGKWRGVVRAELEAHYPDL